MPTKTLIYNFANFLYTNHPFTIKQQLDLGSISCTLFWHGWTEGLGGKIKSIFLYYICLYSCWKMFPFTNKECLTQHRSPSTWHYTTLFGFYVNILYHIRRREISYWDHIFWFYSSFWNFKLFHYTDTFHFLF